MAFFDDTFRKFFSDLPAPILFPLENDQFSISAIFFQYKVDSFNIEYEVNLDCIFFFS